MTIGGPHSGRFGVLNGISAVRQWQINDAATPSLFLNSATAGGHGRKPGTNNWNGSYGAHGAVPFAFPGTSIAFKGYTAPDTDIAGGVGSSYAGAAFIDAISSVWDWAGGNVMSHQVQFSGDGVLTETDGDTAIVDGTISDPEAMSGLHIDFSTNGTTWTPIGNITQATLNIQAANPAYVNSSTGGNTKRKGGNIDFNVQLNIEDSKLYGPMTKGSTYQLRMYTTASLFWVLKWAYLIDATNLTTNQETGAIISQTLNLGMAAVNGGVIGSIILPGAMTSAWGT